MEFATPHGSLRIIVDGVWLQLVCNLSAKLTVVCVTIARGNVSREARLYLQPGASNRTCPLHKPKVYPAGSDLKLRVDLYGPDGTLVERKEECIQQSTESLAEGAD